MSWWRVAPACLALVVASDAARAAPADGWARFPSPAVTAAARPNAPGDGRAVLHCQVGDGGDLSGCRVVSESPPGKGFGAAALTLSSGYVRKPPGQTGPREINLVLDWFTFDKAADWLRRPTPSDLLAVYPKAAHGKPGSAVLECLVTTQGGLSECVVESESPSGAGFGQAAIRLSAQFLMRPAMLKGQPVVAPVRLPIAWQGFDDSAWSPGRSVAPANLAWAEAPSFVDVAAAYPAKARAEKKAGRVTLNCDMNEEGRLAHCQSVNAEPSHYGFEDAAKTLARRFRFPVTNESEKKTARSLAVMMPFSFDPAALDLASPVIGKPTWAAIPNSSQFLAAFGPLKLAATARATLSCVVLPAGSLGDCSIISEQPSGAGVGAAALSLSPTFRVSTWTTEGLPVVGGRITIPLRFEPDTTPAATAQPTK